MTASKFDIAITDDGGEKLAKLLTNAKFVRIVNSTDTGDVLQSELMLIRFMQSLYGDDNYLKLEDHYDGNMLSSEAATPVMTVSELPSVSAPNL